MLEKLFLLGRGRSSISTSPDAIGEQVGMSESLRAIWRMPKRSVADIIEDSFMQDLYMYAVIDMAVSRLFASITLSIGPPL